MYFTENHYLCGGLYRAVSTKDYRDERTKRKTMQKKKENEELLSRREFFKKAAKGVLPMLGAIALSSMPVVSQAAEKAPTSCAACNGTCSTGCDGGCLHGCGGGCKGSCASTCRGGCELSCYHGCSTSCSGGSTGQVTNTYVDQPTYYGGGGGCNGCSSTCTGTCTGGCTNGCSGTCSGTCSATCQNDCNNHCVGTGGMEIYYRYLNMTQSLKANLNGQVIRRTL